MATLTGAELEIIAKNPLGDSIFKDRDTILKADPPAREYTPQDLAFPPNFQRLFADVMGKTIATLVGSPVAVLLASRSGGMALASDLVAIRIRLLKGDIDINTVRLLSQTIVNKASDVDIWTAAINITIAISSHQSTSSRTLLREDTPPTTSSASQQGNEQTRLLVEERILDEIRFSTYVNVEGFHSKYFTRKSWSEQAEQVWSVAEKMHNGKRWTDFPETPAQDDVCKWLLRLQKDLLGQARSVYVKSTQTNMANAETKFRPDLHVKVKGAGEQSEWKDVVVVGELKQSNYDWKKTVIQIGCYVRDVFANQPTRRFVHAFALYGAEMESWVFDRSGPYSAIRFDIHVEPERFIQVLCGYVMMSDEELGLDTFVEQQGGKMFVTLHERCGKKRKFELEPEPIAYQRAIVCRGTTCYRAKGTGAGFDYVVKFSWVSDKRPPEADLLEEVGEKGIKGVARLVGEFELTDIAGLRSGLNFDASKRHKFHGISAGSLPEQSRPSQRSSNSVSKLRALSAQAQRKRQSDGPDGSSKRSRFDGSNDTSASRREPSNSSLLQRNDDPFDNRVLRVLAIAPAGRSIRQFTTPVELVAALRDAVKAHQSLYIDGHILHRDISENNIIITNPKQAEGFHGMLIDLDLAKVVGTPRSGARHRTGTLQFMAIGVLKGERHTYRHDLESFFYVLVWLSARRAWDLPGAGKRPASSDLTGWYTGSYPSMVATKTGQMDKQLFEAILTEIPAAFEEVKPLCRQLRDVLFPYRDGLYTGTPEAPGSLYQPMLQAFDSTLQTMRAKT